MLDLNTRSEPAPTNFVGNAANENSSMKANTDNGDVFYETPAAQGISGFFVALAIIITVHQVSVASKLDILKMIHRNYIGVHFKK